MAKLIEQQFTITLSKIIKNNETESPLVGEDFLENLEIFLSEMCPEGTLIELSE